MSNPQTTKKQQAELMVVQNNLLNASEEARHWLTELQVQLREKEERIVCLKRELADERR